MLNKIHFARLLFFPSFITTVFWLFSKIFVDQIDTGIFTILTQISSLIGTTMIAMTFILSARIKIVENFFDGFDNSYKAHKYNGILGYIFILIHFVSLIIPAMEISFENAMDYVLPFSNLAYNSGILSFYLFSVLISLTIVSKIPYHIWKMTHNFMGIAMLLASIHVFTIKSDVSEFLPLKIWMIFICLISLFSAFYQRFFWKKFSRKYDYKISKIFDFGNVIDLYIVPENNDSKKLDFFPGQYAFLQIDAISSEKHPFSISSSPDENFIRFSIKKLGDYTKKLEKLKSSKPETSVKVFGPYGKFGDKFVLKNFQNHEKIFLAGGIGVAPFLSFIRYENSKNKNSKIQFFYSVNNDSDRSRESEISNFFKTLKSNFNFKIIDTRKQSRIDQNFLKSHLKKSKKNSLFFICGSKNFMENMINILVNLGISKNKIIVEDFNFK